jgi:hypothetical protein
VRNTKARLLNEPHFCTGLLKDRSWHGHVWGQKQQ